MQREKTGHYEVTTIGNERVDAFVPVPLPPSPPLSLASLLPQLLEAQFALGELQGFARLFPEPEILKATCIRIEAVQSSLVEGIPCSYTDLYLFEIGEQGRYQKEFLEDVANCVASIEHGIKRLKEDLSISSQGLMELHRILMSSSHNALNLPGEFRLSQNWIGGMQPGKAVFIPPPANLVPDCMHELEKFLHEDKPNLPALIQAGLVHVQFETVHPFLDGNGRVGRILIMLVLMNENLVTEPLLYLSQYIYRNRREYYDLLNTVRKSGDWERWLAYILQGVTVTANNVVKLAENLTDLFKQDELKVIHSIQNTKSSLKVYQAFKNHPVLTRKELVKRTGLTFPAVSSAVLVLQRLNIVSEISKRKRNQLFAYTKFLEILEQKPEPNFLTDLEFVNPKIEV